MRVDVLNKIDGPRNGGEGAREHMNRFDAAELCWGAALAIHPTVLGG
jgi:hypothetical protein